MNEVVNCCNQMFMILTQVTRKVEARSSAATPGPGHMVPRPSLGQPSSSQSLETSTSPPGPFSTAAMEPRSPPASQGGGGGGGPAVETAANRRSISFREALTALQIDDGPTPVSIAPEASPFAASSKGTRSNASASSSVPAPSSPFRSPLAARCVF